MPEPSDPFTTEDQLRAVTVGELTPLSAPILIVDYDPNWPRLFERESDRIRSLLGSGASRIEHVGSTSIPGLAAKPIIDMVLVVRDSADEPSYVTPLEVAGYVLRIREPAWHQHRMLRGSDTNLNLHVFSAGCPEVDRMILFSDWLRCDEADRLLYERTKRELASRPWKYTQNYADAKTSVIEEIMQRARLGNRGRYSTQR